MPRYSKPLGEAVRRARMSLNLTQAQVAERANVDPRTVLNIENYKGNPKFAVLVALVRTLNIDPDEVFYPETKSNRPAVQRLKYLIESCDEQEAEELIPILEAVIRALRRRDRFDV